MCGIQMIDRLEWIHSKNIVHRDIKPDNFVMGRNEAKHIVYLLDFGLSKKYWSTKTNSHIKYTLSRKLTGTARYASINALKGGEQSRRDDLEALCYVLIYFLKGELPWQGIQVDRKEDRYKKIYEIKKDMKEEEICSGIPMEFVRFLKYTKNLAFEANPDYNYLRALLKNVLLENSLNFDYIYDWTRESEVINDDLRYYYDKDTNDFKSNLHPDGNVNQISDDKDDDPNGTKGKKKKKCIIF